MSTSLLVMPVHAGDKPAKRAPEGQWRIESVESPQTGKKPYCVLIQPYNRDSRLTISYNDKQQVALALDLGSKLMNPSKNYSVSLKPENGNRHRRDVSPLSDSEFIIRMGADAETFQQIQAADEMRLALSGENFDIVLPDMKDVNSALSQCVQRVVASAKRTAAAPRVEDDTNSQLAALRAENSELRQSLKQARHKLENSQMQIEGSARVAELEEKIKTLQSKLAEAGKSKQKASKNAAKDKDAATVNKAARLRKTLANKKAAHKNATERIQELQQKLSQKQQALSQLKQEKSQRAKQLSRLRENREQWQKTKDELAKLKQEKSQLSKKLSRLRENREQWQKTKDELNRLKQEKSRLSQKLSQLQSDLSRLKQENQQLSQQQQSGARPEIASLRETNRRLRQKLEKVRKKHSGRAKQSKQCDFADNNGMSQQRMDDLKNRLSSLQQNNRRLRDNLSSARSRLENIMGKNKSGSADSGQSNLQITQRYHEAQREIRRLGNKLREKRKSCQQEIRELEEMLFDPRLAESKQISVLNKLESKLKKARAKIDRLKSRQSRVNSASVDETGPVEVSQPVKRASLAQQHDKRASSLEAQARKDRKSGPDQKVRKKAKATNNNEISSGGTPADLRKSGKNGPQQKSDDAIGRIARDLDDGRKIYTDKNALAALLSRSGIRADGDIGSVDKTRDDVYAAYQWDHGPVYGSAKFRKIADKQSFTKTVDRYLATARSRCPADFSARPTAGLNAGGGSLKVSAYDIACVGDNVDNAASIVFMRDSSNFGVVAFESGTDQMSTTMQYRDAVLQTVASTKTAQR